MWGDRPGEVGAGSNCAFAWIPRGGQEPFINPFDGTHRVTLALDGQSSVGLEVVAGSSADIRSYHDPRSRTCAYVWGTAAHPNIAKRDLLPWCIETTSRDDFREFSEIVGVYVILIDDRAKQRVTWFNDPWSVRPWFIGQHNGQVFGGSSVWPIQCASLSNAQVNYDAVANWLHYGYDFSGGSLLSDYRRLKPLTVTMIERGRITEHAHARIIAEERRAPLHETADAVYERVEQSFNALTEGIEAVTVGLTGGYDSRLLAALCARRKELRATAVVVQTRKDESILAKRVADRLNIPLQYIPTNGSQWDVYRQPHHFLADGFPITKQVSYAIADRWRGIPTLNGYLGDSLIRGTGNRIDWQEMEAFDEQQATKRQFTFRRLVANRVDLLNSKNQRRIRERARESIRLLVHEGRDLGKAAFYSALAGRQRFYTSNNFLQHLDHCEGLVPFYSWRLFDYRLRHHYDCFAWDTYEMLFRRHVPTLSDIPNDVASNIPYASKPRSSHVSRRWAAELLIQMSRRDFLPTLSRKKTVPRLLGAAAGRLDVEPVARFVMGLHLLESRARAAGIAIDWNQI